MLTEEYGADSLVPPPRNGRRRTSDGNPDDGGGFCSCSCCCACICWCCCFLFLLVFAAAASAAYFAYLYKPRAPSYSVSGISVSRFDVSAFDLTVYARLVATVRAENPNAMIGIGYGEGSRTAVSYRGTTLCSGTLPVFYQGYRNTTVMEIAMEGRHGFGSGLQSALEEGEKAGHVPLDVYVSVPVTLRLGTFDLRQVTVNVHCALVVDSLSPKKKPAIKSAHYWPYVEF
ncbi:NDR1/HIN1-like protein 6 [Brachypodium distachyon]|nr:NDR1/HIN1-like protein 6 [Brachypodium distachyon]|eukprot:XP_024316342.1 NDR1/HIN1-like protein 6 [Brachypodium distachyon]